MHGLKVAVQPFDGGEEAVAGDRGMLVILATMGRTPFTTRRWTGKMRSMYQFMTSGSDRSRRVSAVGAQSTTIRS